MIVYHEASIETLDSILSRGLKRTSRGEMGTDEMIVRINTLLDEHRSQILKEAGVSRDNNTYAYLTTNSGIVDIVTGNDIAASEKADGSERALLRLDVTATRCYVSDLDAYDVLKSAAERDENSKKISDLVQTYWDKLVRLDDYKMGQIDRPEVMITYDIPPSHIEVVSLPQQA